MHAAITLADAPGPTGARRQTSSKKRAGSMRHIPHIQPFPSDRAHTATGHTRTAGQTRPCLAAIALIATAVLAAGPAAAQTNGPPPATAPARTAQAATAAPALAPASSAAPKASASPTHAEQMSRLRRIRNWGYQLKRISKRAVAASPFDLMVIDYAPDRIGGREHPFTRAELAAMQKKPDGGRRLVFAYFSIGEAEYYRNYWQASWSTSPPAWLGPMNAQWPGNYPVRFWSPAWQALMFGSPGAYLDRILAAGFDGIYIDRADVADYWLKGRPGARNEMASLVARISAYARRKRPELLILMQNAEELLDRRQVVDAIDGVAKEDLFYGINHDQSANSRGDVQASVDLLQRLKRRGKAVLVVEYLAPGSAKGEDARRRSRRLGYVPLIAERALDTMPRPAP
jgi:cysteinyl-tRNA synthetase